ncbi:MAG TPA: Imm63 family immunity protein [Longimicrobium sp.]|nr:Imm63 family immunity protein [Longimicrobium sp.]
MDPDLGDLHERYKYLCELLGHAPAYSHQHQIQTRPLVDGAPHVEVVSGRYEYVVTERGKELQRRTAEDEDELLYWLISDVTRGVAIRLGSRIRFRNQDSRRQWFAKDVALLSKLRPEWGDRKRAEYAQILSTHPFRDRKAENKRGWFRFWK